METLESRIVYANQWLSVREDSVRRSDGSTGIHAVIDSPDIALILPCDGERLHLVEQYRYPIAGRRWGFPSGSADPNLDLDAEASARRELREESGLEANTLTPLGMLEVTPSLIDHECRVFLATGLSQGEPHHGTEEPDMRSAWFERSEVHRMIADGDMTDAKSIAAFALLLIRQAA